MMERFSASNANEVPIDHSYRQRANCYHQSATDDDCQAFGNEATNDSPSIFICYFMIKVSLTMVMKPTTRRPLSNTPGTPFIVSTLINFLRPRWVLQKYSEKQQPKINRLKKTQKQLRREPC